MVKTGEIKIAGQDEKVEAIIRQHRRWTHLLENRRTIGEGSLVLTNRRLLFLHRIEASPVVTASIKKLADAPVETVLNHALTLHKKCFQISLSSIVNTGIGIFAGFPIPHFYLWVTHLKGKNQVINTVAFQFTTTQHGIFFEPQIITDWGWKGAIQRAVREMV